ncbi:MAG: hypothetical protein JRE88_00900 [Deltaproteobacteria bacterium]|jgi:hypothetical protein|nr:hypothetical protein [Deltaproteobacteria bacterium]
MTIRQFYRLTVGVAIVAIIYLPATIPVSATEILTLNLDSTDALGTTVSADPKVKFEGNGSIRVSTKWPTTICLGQISELNIENTRLTYQARVKSENLDGAAFLEMWCKVGSGQYFSRGLNSTVSGTKDWQTISTVFILNKGQKAQSVTLNLVINGLGTVWVDDIRLVHHPLQ